MNSLRERPFAYTGQFPGKKSLLIDFQPGKGNETYNAAEQVGDVCS
jgi:hypothetical protein